MRRQAVADLDVRLVRGAALAADLWGPDQQIMTRWRRDLGYDVRKVPRFGAGPPYLQLHP